MDSALANAVLENIDSTIFQVFEKFIPLNTAAAWAEAQKQVEGQLNIASKMVDAATSVPDLVIAAKMFWRGKDEGWPDWNQIVCCPAELLKSHPWYRSASLIPQMNSTSTGNVPEVPGDPLSQRKQLGDLPLPVTETKGKRREDSVKTPAKQVPTACSGTPHFDPGNVATSPPRFPENLNSEGCADDGLPMDHSDTAPGAHNELEDECHRGRSGIRATSSVKGGNADGTTRGRRGIFPSCSPGSQVPGACSSCLDGKLKCSLSHNGGSCFQCKMRRKRCDYAGPRGRSRGVSRVPTRQLSTSPSADCPPSKKRRAPPSARRSASPADDGPSKPCQRSPTPAPAKHRRASSRAREKINPQMPPAIPVVSSADPINGPAHPRPITTNLADAYKDSLGPTELGVTLGTAYNLQGEPLVLRKEHEELKSQVAALMVENDWLKSEFKKVCLKIRNVSSAMIFLEGNVEATRQLVVGPRNERPEGCLSFPLNMSAGISRATTPDHSPTPNPPETGIGNPNLIPSIEALAVGISEMASPAVGEPAVNAGDILPEVSATDLQALSWFANDVKAIDTSRIFEKGAPDERAAEGLTGIGQAGFEELTQSPYPPLEAHGQ